MPKGSQDRIGQQLGNYHLLRHLGRGGFAEVYLGEHIYLKSQAALKLLHTRLKEDEQKAFLGEAQMLVRMNHPHIVRVLDFALDDDTPFLVMDYAPGGTLRERHAKGTRLPLETVLPYVQHVASALQYAHDQQLIHRDIKPENMLLGARDEVLLSDFGLAILAPHTESYSTHAQGRAIAGTSLYLAPEQLQGHPGPESDQYGLAVVVYEWLCGRTPFRGTPIEIAMQHLSSPPPSLREHVPDLSPAVEAVVLRALAKEPHDRFERVDDFVRTLEQASGRTPTFPSSSLPPPQVNTPPPSPQGQPEVPISVRRPEPLWKVPTIFTPLVGREQDVTAMAELLQRPEVRLVTLLGAGGIGKTRLGIQVATEMRNAFSDGVCFVGLASISDPELVVSSIAEALEIPQIGGQLLFEQLKLSLRDRSLLLILDNFEQIIAAVPRLEELLAACPALKIVVTSRALLRAQGEQEFPVAPLALPNLRTIPRSDSLWPSISQYSAMVLFVQRARAKQPGFQLTSANARAIAEICVRLDGLPLAIELAAARIVLLPPHALLTRLSQGLQVLGGGARTLPERQQTLRNTLGWSYDLLDAEEQRFFRRLSVFVGGWTLEAVEAVWKVGKEAERGGLSAFDGVVSLLEKSLLLQVEQEGEEPHLQMLVTVREYGLECLRESGEAEAIRRAHALYYLKLAEEAEPYLKGAQQLVWLKRLEQDLENLRAALQWLIEHEEEAELALRFCTALWMFWLIHGYLSEGQRWFEAALGLPNVEARTVVRAKALCGAGELASNLGDTGGARGLLEASVALARALQETRGLAQALGYLGAMMHEQGETAVGRALMEESIALCRKMGEKWLLAGSLQSLGSANNTQNDFATAHAMLEESVALYREVEDTRGLSHSLYSLARLAVSLGDSKRAMSLWQESLAIARELSDKLSTVKALNQLGYVIGVQGDWAQGEALLQESLTLAREIGYKIGLAHSLSYLAQFAWSRGDLVQAAELVKECLAFDREVEDTYSLCLDLMTLGRTVRDQGDLAEATAVFQEGLALAQKMGFKLYIGFHLLGLASLAGAEKHPHQAARLCGTAEDLLDKELDADPLERAEYERLIACVRAQLSEEEFAAAWKQGKSMTPEETLAAPEAGASLEQVSVKPPPAKPAPSPTYPDELTAREVEVLQLVAQGWTDAQIADRLVISARTVNAHVTSIYRKIGVSSRSGATRYAIEKKLLLPSDN